MTPPSGVPDGSVVITPSEVYAKVLTLTEAVTKMLADDAADKRDRDRLESEQVDHGRRLTAVEKKVWVATGAAATLGSTIGSILVSLLK